MSSRIFISLGSNLGDRIAHIESVLAIFRNDYYITDMIISSFYRSDPVDASGGFYINIVIGGTTTLLPEKLLEYLLDIELQCGRKRYAFHNPRTIDIDLLLYDDLVIESDFLTLPHPRMHERAFVMYPLLEIAPDIIIPRINIASLIGYQGQRIERLNSRNLWKGKYAIMGILNITDDSFYDGGKYIVYDQAMERVQQMISEGVDIIDIGGQSSKPGAIPISEVEEISRIEPILRGIRERFPDIPLSIDTYRSGVIKMAKEYKIDIINDISAGNIDPEMLETVIQSGCTYVLMHMQGEPSTMQSHTQYSDLIPDIYSFMQEKIEYLQSKGCTDIIIDPGFGFGKTLSQNYQLLSQLSVFKKMGLPILVGLSRKSMVYKPLNITSNESLPGSCALHMTALINGAQVLRVHDVVDARNIIKLFSLYEESCITNNGI